MKKKILLILIMLLLLTSGKTEVYSNSLNNNNIEILEPTLTPIPLKVTIYSSAKTPIRVGELIYLTSKIEGFDDYEIRYQWQCDKGEGFFNLEDGISNTYSFPATKESLTWNWRLIIYYK